MDLGSVVESYQYLQANHQIIGSMLTAEVTYVTGDVLSQLILDKKVDSKRVAFTAKLAPLYGLGIEALMQSGELVGNYVSNEPFIKSVLGPNLWGNLYNSFFFVNNSVGHKNDYEVGKLIKNYVDIIPKKGESFIDNLKEKYLDNVPNKEFFYSVIGTLTFWNAFQWYNYAINSEEMRTPAALGVGVVWVGALSLWSLISREKKVVESVSVTTQS